MPTGLLSASGASCHVLVREDRPMAGRGPPSTGRFQHDHLATRIPTAARTGHGGPPHSLKCGRAAVTSFYLPALTPGRGIASGYSPAHCPDFGPDAVLGRPALLGAG